MGLLQKLGLARKPGTVVLEQHTLAHVADLAAGGWRGDVVADGRGVWVLTPQDDKITRFDAASAQEVAEFESGRDPRAFLLDERGLLVLRGDSELARLDPMGGSELQRVKLAEPITNLAAGEGRLWGLCSTDFDESGAHDVVLVQLDPSGLRVQREVRVGRSTIDGGLHVAEGKVAVLIETAPRSMGEVVLDAGTGERLPEDAAPERRRALARRDGSLWRGRDGVIQRLDAQTERVEASYEPADYRGGKAVLAGGKLWAICHRPVRTGEGEHLD